MDAERARKYLLSLPHVLEAEQWGGLIFWLGDKSLGGKMFCMINPDVGEKPISYPAGPERFAELVERDGLIPAPYMARIFWVAAERWGVFRDREWEEELRAAHALTLAKLPPKTKATFLLSESEQKRLVAERRGILAEKKAQRRKRKV